MTDTLKKLVEKTRTLPEQVADLTVQLAAKRQALHDLLNGQKEIETLIGGQVAAENGEDGRKRFPNEESRKAEVARRLKADTRYQAIEQELTKVRGELVDLEARLEQARYEFRAANTLLTLLASALQANRPDVEQAVLAHGAEAEAPEEPKAEAEPQAQEPKPEAQGQAKADGLETGTFTVLEVRAGKSEGTVRAYCEGDTGKVAVYAKNGAAKVLSGAAGRKVEVRFRRLDKGLFAVEARPVA
jgi:chromosome segregation ATPase